MLTQFLRAVAKAAARPYVSRELPGWGKVYAALVGDWRRDWLWHGHSPVVIRNKLYGYESVLDISKWSDRATFFLGRWYDLQAQLFLQQILRPGDTVVDIGANRGNFTFAAASIVGPSGHVLAFEPNPAQFSRLQDERMRNGFDQVTAFNQGLGDENTELVLHVPDVNSGEASFGVLNYAQQTDVTVAVRIGDEALPRDLMPRLVKIDVEGFEGRVIKGLSQLIWRARPIIMTEVKDHHLSSCGFSRRELIAQVMAMDYRGLGCDIKRDGKKRRVELRGMSDADYDIIWIPNELKESDLTLNNWIRD